MKRPSTATPELLRWLQMQGDADRRILAQLWSLPPESDPAALAAALADPRRVREQWERISPTERAVLTRVLQAGGAIPVAIAEREWGVIREPARFANPRAYLQALQTPASPAERLYLMGILVRGYDQRGPVLRVLNDLYTLLPAPPPRDRRLQVTPVDEPPQTQSGAPDTIERTLLGLLRLADEGELRMLQDGGLDKASLVRLAQQITPGEKLGGLRREANWPWVALLRSAAEQAGLVRRTSDGLLHWDARATGWLRAPRTERLAALLRGWLTSPFNELTQLCGLQFKGTPPVIRLPESRQTVLDLLASLPAGVWLPADGIGREVERIEPDFLRRDGRYDTGLLYDARGQLVAGREGWPRVEGELLRALLFGPLHWMGLTDVGGSEHWEAVRLTPVAAHVLQGAAPPDEAAPEPLSVQGTFEVVCPPGASLFARWMLGRIAELVRDDTASIYRLTRRSVLRAVERGMSAEDLLQFLEAYGRAAVPQGVATYVREWATEVGQLRLEEAALLRADDPLKLAEVRKARGIALPPLEPLTETAWKIAPGDAPALLQQLERAGFSVEASSQGDGPARGRSGKQALSDHDLKALVTAAYAYAHVCAQQGIPCEVSSSMLMRLRKLVPSRHIAAAEQAAAELVERLKQ